MLLNQEKNITAEMQPFSKDFLTISVAYTQKKPAYTTFVEEVCKATYPDQSRYKWMEKPIRKKAKKHDRELYIHDGATSEEFSGPLWAVTW